MKPHYRRHKGWRRNPGPGGRPVYYMPMSREEVRERRLLYGLIGAFVTIVGSGILWVVTLA